jgi:hypothetical protein
LSEDFVKNISKNWKICFTVNFIYEINYFHEDKN